MGTLQVLVGRGMPRRGKPRLGLARHGGARSGMAQQRKVMTGIDIERSRCRSLFWGAHKQSVERMLPFPISTAAAGGFLIGSILVAVR